MPAGADRGASRAADRALSRWGPSARDQRRMTQRSPGPRSRTCWRRPRPGRSRSPGRSGRSARAAGRGRYSDSTSRLTQNSRRPPISCVPAGPAVVRRTRATLPVGICGTPTYSNHVSRLSATDEPPSYGVDPCCDLVAAGRGQLRAAAAAAEIGMDDGMGLAGLGGIRRDQLVEFLAVIGKRAVSGHLLRRLPPASVADLLLLAVAQHMGHLVGLEQPRQPEVVILLLAPRDRAQPELLGIEEHVVEQCVGLQRLEATLCVQRLLRGVGLGQEVLLGAPVRLLGPL